MHYSTRVLTARDRALVAKLAKTPRHAALARFLGGPPVPKPVPKRKPEPDTEAGFDPENEHDPIRPRPRGRPRSGE